MPVIFGLSSDMHGNICLDAQGEALARQLAVDKLIVRHMEEFKELHTAQREQFIQAMLDEAR